MKFPCPHCGQHFSAENDAGGQMLDCPACGQGLVIPVVEQPMLRAATATQAPQHHRAARPVRYRKDSYAIWTQGWLLAVLGLVLVAGIGYYALVAAGKLHGSQSAEKAAPPPPQVVVVLAPAAKAPVNAPAADKTTDAPAEAVPASVR